MMKRVIGGKGAEQMKIKIDIGKVIVLLYENYKLSVETPIVEKPISYALYHTWKYVDNIEKSRLQEQKNE